MNIDISVAEQFGRAIADSDYDAAHRLLREDIQGEWPPHALEEAVAEMIEYASTPIAEVQVMDDFLQTDWPEKQPGDLYWAYISLSGEDFAEAVTVVVSSSTKGGPDKIRSMEWGRP